MLEIYDCTLREGMQAEGLAFTISDKLAVVRALDSLGIAYIEAGTPASNPKDAELFRTLKNIDTNATLTAFGATRKKDIAVEDDELLSALADAGTEVVTLYGKAWDKQVFDILQTSLEENLAMVTESISFMISKGKRVFFDAEHYFDGFADNPDYALQVIRAAASAGAERIILCDTNGGSLPSRISEGVKAAKAVIGDTPLGIHCHNDAGLAVASTLTAVESGTLQIQGTLTGIGERCGNTDLSCVIPLLHLKCNILCVPAERLELLTPVARKISGYLNVKIPNRTPFIGKSAFAHKGGSHIDGVLKNNEAFEHIPPEAVGNKRRLLLSELSGKAAVKKLLKRILPNYSCSEDEVSSVLTELKRLEAYGYQFEVAEESLELRILSLLGLRKKPFEVDYFKIIGETDKAERYTSTAMISLRVGEDTKLTAAEGIGPVNALDHALRSALVAFYPCISEVILRDYKVRVIDDKDSTAAKVRVLIESTDGKNTWTTVGVSADIIEASFIALSDSLEYKLK